MSRAPFTPEQMAKGLETRRRNAQLRREGKLPPRKSRAKPEPAAAAPETTPEPPAAEEHDLLRYLARVDGVLQGATVALRCARRTGDWRAVEDVVLLIEGLS